MNNDSRLAEIAADFEQAWVTNQAPLLKHYLERVTATSCKGRPLFNFVCFQNRREVRGGKIWPLVHRRQFSPLSDPI